MTTNAFDPKCDHRITREEAASLIQNFQAQAKEGAHRASAFNRGAFELLLAQPGAAGIRLYHARHNDGSPTTVMVAVDHLGVDLDGPLATFIQNSQECPPVCAGTRLGR